MSTTTPRTNDRGVIRDDTLRANPTGAYVATVGAVVLLISVFLPWIDNDKNKFSGYESDSLIPFSAYLALGCAAALLYAAKRATRRQHRGLSLASMAAGVAATLLALSYAIDTPGAAERGAEWDSEIGIYIGLLGALIWTIGSYLLAKEPEGDIEHDDRADHHDTLTHHGTAYDASHGIETHGQPATRHNTADHATTTDSGRGGAGN